MALKLVYSLLLWDLVLLAHCVTSACNVTCSTDFKYSLNCSCTVLTDSVNISVNCREEDLELNTMCEVKPPQSWCVMSSDLLDTVAVVGTECTSKVIKQRDGEVYVSESTSWALSDVVKPLPPFNVTVTNYDGFYNISWDHDNQEDCLKYDVRIRESSDLSKVSLNPEVSETKNIVIQHEKLPPHISYTVEVRAKLCPEKVYEGPWSEWSSSAEWGTTTEDEGITNHLLYIPLALFVLGLLVMGYKQKPYWQKKLQLITYVPKPDEFFKPLYHNYGGNFKEWVKPAFSECDYLRISSQAQTISEKQHDVVHWSQETQCCRDDNETKQGGHFLRQLQTHSNSLLCFQDGGSSQGTGHSTGHISIHTVTLSGEEEFEEEVASQHSVDTLRSYHGGERFSSFGEDSGEQADYDLEEPQMLGRQNGVLPHLENQIFNNLSVENLNFHPRVQLNEPERVSLDSFASNDQSEDGYPHVDLDTIDSGFGECSSPGASDSNIAEQLDCDSFHEHKSSNSNYVKQWMVCNTIQEDCSSPESQLHETH